MMGIESNFDIPLIAGMALKEKQIQQNYRPIIAVHKWFARRPGTLFRGLVLAEFGNRPLARTFFRENHFPGRVVADPFMGGGTPLLEANRVGCDVLGFDINPMAAWIVREEMGHLDLRDYRAAANLLIDKLQSEIGEAYRTDCPIYGDRDVPVKYFLWVTTIDCEKCGRQIDLFPGYLLAENARHPKHVLVCADCGGLSEVDDRHHPGKCRHCRSPLREAGPAKRGQCICPGCRYVNRYPRPEARPPGHRVFAIEYYNPKRRDRHPGRFFKVPDAQDLARFDKVKERRDGLQPSFVPDEIVPAGDETDRLHRWGYTRYRDLFNPRQLLGLELSCRLIAEIRDQRVRHALATNLSDLLRYQNMLCRYDTMALKSLDIFSVHGFPVGPVQCESNLIGIVNGGGTNVGSGGWKNIVEKYAKAKEYCSAPFEVYHRSGRKVIVPVRGEQIGEQNTQGVRRKVAIGCADAATADLPDASLDAVFTDPPYFGNVQYGELMDFCYVWLRRLAGTSAEGFDRISTRSPDELTGNMTGLRDLAHFTDGLSAVYKKMARALKPGAPLAFTFHHNALEAYGAVGVAVLDSGLTCSATIPCPAEMSGSIHIHGTGSSIVDTVFVCRVHGRASHRHHFESPEELAELVRGELAQLRAAGMKPRAGDIRCIVYGHLTRISIWNLRKGWDATRPTSERLKRFAICLAAFGDPQAIIKAIIDRPNRTAASFPLFDGRACDAVSV